MQTLDIISINLWQMLFAFLNLVILFLLVKKFLYKPVKKMLETRQNTIATQYREAEDAKKQALANQKNYEEKLSKLETEADSLIQSAVTKARAREDEIVAEAKTKADSILHQAEENARLETKKAEQAIREEMIEVGTLIASKMLSREIREEDHRQMIDSFIDEIGEENEGNK